MNVLLFILVAIGGFIGAVARFAISQYVKRNFSFTFPAATLFVNIIGSFLLGFFNGLDVGEYMLVLAGTGFCGAFTTFSTFKLEAVQLHVDNQKKAFLFYTIVTYAGGIFSALVGYQLGLFFF
ncbi:fluoride efflux transporter CrcB [Virgibacillus senegalensis]|uniref:fluoride efflux transporter CrcB n=1 Tax=Virgibacillus senegalensis TaxID=1499679 RepID=UPI00069DD103|nr:fluoride efflux transporter CrcB [Virgibacillus senegalensis]